MAGSNHETTHENCPRAWFYKRQCGLGPWRLISGCIGIMSLVCCWGSWQKCQIFIPIISHESCFSLCDVLQGLAKEWYANANLSFSPSSCGFSDFCSLCHLFPWFLSSQNVLLCIDHQYGLYIKQPQKLVSRKLSLWFTMFMGEPRRWADREALA